MTFDEAVAFALTLPDTVATTSYRQPAVGVASNGRAFLSRGHEQDTSFVLMLAAEKSRDTFLAPVGIGLALFAAELVGKSDSRVVQQ